jgi:cysteinyl-tRNA synthetase
VHPASPPPFRLYDTRSRDVRVFEPVHPGKLSLYVCGMTVYDEIHVGHARAMVVFDTFVRYLRFRGWDVTFARNFTDVDDKIIDRAIKRGEPAAALADRYIANFHRDTDSLGLVRPDLEPRVTETIPPIVAMIAELVAAGHAYPAEGSVWFSVASFPAYGALSNQSPDEMRSADPEGGKRAAADFALWKAAKPGEPAWDSPWGPGRPGWHIECSAMVRHYLGNTIDIHGGGLDLVFPHHENEIAQSEAANHMPFANCWMHNGLLTMSGGQKMSKSLGNVVNVEDILREYPPEALRLYYLQNHYRSPLPWDPEAALPEALGMLARLYEAVEVGSRMVGLGPPEGAAAELGPDALEVLTLGRAFQRHFLAALDEDFNTARALGYAFELARAINRLSNHKKAASRGGTVVAPALEAIRLLGPTLGLLEDTPAGFAEQVKARRLPALGLTAERVEEMLAARTAARTRKDWAEADRLRAELDAAGIVVMDRADGSEWRVRV